MAKAKKTSALALGIFGFIVGAIVGFGGVTYFKLPLTEELVLSEEVYYSKDGEVKQQVGNISVDDADISIHFLELGNKYTGDCTYIKTKNCDILIDCGSKSSSIPYVAEYLNKYVADNTLEYVIVTHAHQDHYAGFATSTKIDSIFDLFVCKNIIKFSKTNQKETGATYKNFLRELNDEKAAGANVFEANECVGQTFNIDTNTTLKILDSYYYTNKATTENNYSVCTLITQNDNNYIFTGDLEEDGEAKLIEKNSLPQVDLYKAGHHGSKTSSSVAFLEKIQPKVCCVCCCAGSPEYTKNVDNQFPTQQFIDNISKWTNEVYVTSLCIDYDKNEFTSFNGNIVYLQATEGYNINCSNNNTKLKDCDWFKSNRTCPTNWL